MHPHIIYRSRQFLLAGLLVLSICTPIAPAGALPAAALPLLTLRAPGPAFHLTARGPAANALDVAVTASLNATFDANLNTTTVSTATFTLRSEMTGQYDGVFSFPTAGSLSFDPAANFKAGETLFVTAASPISSTLGDDLQPYTWQFTAATTGGGGAMAAQPITPTFDAGDSYDAALGDLDGDGDLDAVMANILGQAETVWLNDGGGGFSAHPGVPSFGGEDSWGLALGDLDGDGDLDAVAANWGAEEPETVWLNDGGGGYSAHPGTPTFGAGYSTAVALGDLDGDGDLDAVVANYNGQAETAWLNDGGGGFSPHPTAPSFGAGNSTDLALGDLDGDGDLDAVVANIGQAQTVWLNDGGGVFQPPFYRSVFWRRDLLGVALGDLDDDGDLDAILAKYNNEAETVWLNDGDGGYSPHPTNPSFGAGTSIDVILGDLDGDGDLDAVVANTDGEAETVWMNDGDGGYSPHPTNPSFGAGNSIDLTLGDLDGDGHLDAVVANTSDQAETVWLNSPFTIYLPLIRR